MPAYLRGLGNERDVATFVLLNAVFCYGWMAKDLASSLGISAAELNTALGHMDATVADAIANRVMVMGANSPKPARVVKPDRSAPTSQKASTSTFRAYNKAAAATAAGWRNAGRQRGVSLTPSTAGLRSLTAIAKLSGNINYAFPMNTADFLQYGAALGLEDAASITTETERNRLVVGSITKPGRATLRDTNGRFTTHFSTADEASAIAAGFQILYTEYIEYPATAPAGP